MRSSLQDEIPTLVKLAPQRLEKRIVRTHDEAALRSFAPVLAPNDADAIRAYVIAQANARRCVRPLPEVDRGQTCGANGCAGGEVP